MLGLNLMNSPPESGVVWTPNYNGVNSYVDIPDWNPSGLNYEIAGTVFITEDLSTVFGNSEDSIYLLLEDADIHISVPDAGLGDSVIANAGWLNTWQTFRIVVDYNEAHVFFFNQNQVYSYIKRWNQSDRINAIGMYKNKSFMKGQISALKFIDRDNPANSRYYKGIVSANEMPQATIVREEYGSGLDGVMFNFGNDQPWVPLLADREAYAGDYNANDWVHGVAIASRNGINAITHGGGNVSGSWGNERASIIPNDSIVIAKNAMAAKVKAGVGAEDFQVDFLNGSEALFQKGFEYPNTFTVIKPTDSDYSNYL